MILIMVRKKNPESDSTIGRRLAQLRKKQGITQKELAEKLGTQQTIISDYETGRLRIHAEMLVQLAEALKASADEILGIKKPPAEKESSLRLLKRVRKIEELPPFKQKVLIQTIDTFLKAG